MLELTLRICLSLLIVLGLVWTFARLRRNRTRRHGAALDVLARRQLTRGGAVALVRVADRALILGVTDQRVNLLAETSLDPALDAPAAPRPVLDAPSTPRPTLDMPSTPRPTLDMPGTPHGCDSPRPVIDAPGTARSGWAARLRLPGQPPCRGSRPQGRTGGGPARYQAHSALAGSVLSAQTWRDTIEFFRERTVRRS